MQTKLSTNTITNDIRLEWPPTGERCRPVVRRSNYRVTGKYPSFRTGLSVRWESAIERDCFFRLDADPTVSRFTEQPVVIHYFDAAGIARKHYPDLLIERRGSRMLWEIKAADDSDLPAAQERASILEPLLLRHGYDYQVVTDSKIRTEPHLTNAKTLLRFGRTPVEQLTREAIRRIFDSSSSITWHDILTGRIGPNGVREVAHLILTGVLTFDMDKPLGPQAVISLNVPHLIGE